MKSRQLPLVLDSQTNLDSEFLEPARGKGSLRAIETEEFPFEQLSSIAEAESWRKEVYRPNYHIHKWWAQRLGSVFRGILLGTFAPADADVMKLFYQRTTMSNAVVFDPFMGSGTTIGESLKLGAHTIGRDINAVAYFQVRTGLSLPPRDELQRTFRAIEKDVSPTINSYYQAKLPDGQVGNSLYFFWVKQVSCPDCHTSVDLFSSYVFAKHAYPRSHPEARILCPACGEINTARFDSTSVECCGCSRRFDPSIGPAQNTVATCGNCRAHFSIAVAVRQAAKVPDHRMYAKIVLTPEGEKVYLRADDFDHSQYMRAQEDLQRRKDPYPVARLDHGYNTDQVLGYGYTHWHQMFNARQLECLSILADRIRGIEDARQRNVFCCLFSGALEFNNMFSSFKGEGTGAVRHMFSHHILKPERTPLEANLWGTPKSSGSFSTMFQTRILRAVEYCEDPFELKTVAENGRISGKKVFGLSEPLYFDEATTFAEFERGKRLYLSCGNSGRTDLADKSVDAVVTDPPFFDNVHYSQLADFFYVWQRHILGPANDHAATSTRSEEEVQQSDAHTFAQRLTSVWQECHRVLKDAGLLVFTYQHSRPEGWRTMLESLVNSGFQMVRCHPIKAEMSVATPKQLARDPINIDMILVCRKVPQAARKDSLPGCETPQDALSSAMRQIRRFRASGRTLTKGDLRVVLMANLARVLSLPNVVGRWEQFDAFQSSLNQAVDELSLTTIETIEIMSDPVAMEQLRKGIQDVKEGRTIPWEEAKKQLGWS